MARGQVPAVRVRGPVAQPRPAAAKTGPGRRHRRQALHLLLQWPAGGAVATMSLSFRRQPGRPGRKAGLERLVCRGWPLQSLQPERACRAGFRGRRSACACRRARASHPNLSGRRLVSRENLLAGERPRSLPEPACPAGAPRWLPRTPTRFRSNVPTTARSCSACSQALSQARRAKSRRPGSGGPTRPSSRPIPASLPRDAPAPDPSPYNLGRCRSYLPSPMRPENPATKYQQAITCCSGPRE